MEIKTENKESKRQRFVRIIERRVTIILNNFDSLGKCANKKNYDFTDEDIKKIFNEIDKKTREIKAIFAGKSTNNKGFKLE